MDAADWRLAIEGDAVANPLSLTYDDILDMPSRTFVSYLECAGNHRSMFDLVKGQAAKGTQWGTGAVSNGKWTGTALHDVLVRAGIMDGAVSVLLIGLDNGSPEEGFRRVMPVEKAMDKDTLLAYSLNGEPLPKDHGFPLRALAPGWVGAASIKWLGRIVVSTEQLWTRNNTTSYTLIGDAYPPEGGVVGQAGRQCRQSRVRWRCRRPTDSGGRESSASTASRSRRPDLLRKVEWSRRFRGDLERLYAGRAADSSGIRASSGGFQ